VSDPARRPLNAIVLAAGRGERLGAERPKASITLAGRPLASWCLETLGTLPGLDAIVLVGDATTLAPALAALTPGARARVARVVPGGPTRQESCALGLAALAAKDGVVLVHDAARPFTDAATYRAVADAAARTGAALCAIPLADTLKRVAEGRVLETVSRHGLWRAQTPQGFEVGLFRRAHAEATLAGVTATDDTALVERLAAPVEVVPGADANRKITTAEDLAWAEARLAAKETPR
jgi:2-C-methyl-D-erythritol 4-phosphate cytidylyltransferase/2-C-methyl-D-erythritol 2,4-cyclodiphosphate synthase